MKRSRIVFFLGLFCSVLYAQQEGIVENDSLILWQADRKLTWSDFKGKPKPVRIHNAAGIGTYLDFFYQSVSNQLPVFTFLNYFEKDRSWSITNDTLTLEHEQIHFDIEEVFTRKIRQCVEELNEEYEIEIEKYLAVIDKILAKCQEVQEKYDYEVLANYARQLEWRAKIDAELDALREYEYVPDKQ